MNNQLIEKVIKLNNEICPEFFYESPLLDRNVAKALSKSFIKILNIPQQNSKTNNNLRLSILENIRKMCQIEPNDHVKVDENFIEILTEFHSTTYGVTSVLSKSDTVNKTLDAFLLRKTEDCELNSSYKSELNPEVIQSLINLKQTGIFDTLTRDVIHWNVKDCKYFSVMKELFNKNEEILKKTIMIDDISIKMIPEIEKMFIELCLSLLEDKDKNIESLFVHNNSLQQLIKTCSVSSKCFQICSRILNYIFIVTNCDMYIQTFISKFINFVKSNCSHVTFSVLYPTHINHIVVLLDFNEEELPPSQRDSYIKTANRYLQSVQNKQESDLVMLLSHFPRWFDIYFDPKYSMTYKE